MTYLFSCNSSCGRCACGGCGSNSSYSCGNPYSVCPPTSSVTILCVTNNLACSVKLCLTLSDTTTTSTIIAGSASNISVGPYTSGSGATLTITFLQVVVVSTCGSLSPLYYNTVPQTFAPAVQMQVSSSGAVTFTGSSECGLVG
jgi:hypothetical protein